MNRNACGIIFVLINLFLFVNLVFCANESLDDSVGLSYGSRSHLMLPALDTMAVDATDDSGRANQEENPVYFQIEKLDSFQIFSVSNFFSHDFLLKPDIPPAKIIPLPRDSIVP